LGDFGKDDLSLRAMLRWNVFEMLRVTATGCSGRFFRRRARADCNRISSKLGQGSAASTVTRVGRFSVNVVLRALRLEYPIAFSGAARHSVGDIVGRALDKITFEEMKGFL
jgi:hypothetical protein